MTATVAQFKAHFSAYNRDMDQLCQAFVVQAAMFTGGFKGTYASANDARGHSSIISRDPSKAPLGAIHYWAIGTYGHVAVGLGGSKVAMASKNVDKFWGPAAHAIGETTVERYSKRTGAAYVGWSRTNGVNTVRLVAPAAPAVTSDQAMVKKIAAYLNGQKLGKKTTASSDGVRGPVYWWLVQTWGRRDGSYPSGFTIDGKPGTQSRKVEAKLKGKV